MIARQQLHIAHNTRLGRAVLGVAELALAFGLASLALGSGSLWQWALAIILVFMGVDSFIRTVIPHKK